MENDEHMLYTWFLISFKPKKKLEKKKNLTCPVRFFHDPGFRMRVKILYAPFKSVIGL